MWWWRFFRPKSHGPEVEAPERPLPKPVPADPVTDRHSRLQRTVGNQAVQRLARRQHTLRVSPLEDPSERQADHVADVVSRRNTDQVALAREESSSQGAQVGPEVQDRLSGSTGGGHPLPEEVRASMQSTLGADLGEVRVHQDSEAAAMNERLNARAFTSGSHIWLGADESVQDPRLMAHELTHVVQQRGRPGEILQRKPLPGKTPDLEAWRRATIEGANIARERLVDALAGGYLWDWESVAEGVVSVSEEETQHHWVESLANRERRLRTLIQDLIALAHDLESGPIPTAWLEEWVEFPGGNLYSFTGVTAAGARRADVVMSYAHRQVGLGLTYDQFLLNRFYIRTEPVRTRQVAPARISPRGTPAGAWIEVPDPENAPLHYILLRGYGEARGRGPIREIWHDDFGYYYLYKERRIYLPRSPWR